MDEFDGYDVLDYLVHDNSLHYQRIEMDNPLADDIAMQLNTTIPSSTYQMKRYGLFYYPKSDNQT